MKNILINPGFWNRGRLLRFLVIHFVLLFATHGLMAQSSDLLVLSNSLPYKILRYDGTTGRFVGNFISFSSDFLAGTFILGPDGNIYVFDTIGERVLRYNGTTGAAMGVFVDCRNFGLGCFSSLGEPRNPLTFGPDGNLYIGGDLPTRVFRFNGVSGAYMGVFVQPGSGGLSLAADMMFGPDGNLYIISFDNYRIIKYDGRTGAFLTTFVPPFSGGLFIPRAMTFGPDGNLYVNDAGNLRILRFDGKSGAYKDIFVNILDTDIYIPNELIFGPDGHLYISDGYLSSVIRFNGTTGAFMGQFVSSASGGLVNPTAMLFTGQTSGNPRTQMGLTLSSGGAGTAQTIGSTGPVKAGYSVVTGNFTKSNDPAVISNVPYGTAVFSLVQNGTVVSEAGVPSSPPANAAMIFIDYRTGVPYYAKNDNLDAGTISVNTGLAVVNMGTAQANVTYQMRNSAASIIASGTGILPKGAHRAKFIDQLSDLAPNFVLPAGFSTTIQFATLEIFSDQPLSILALRLTTNQRGETLLTTTPVAKLGGSSLFSAAILPHYADGNGNQTTVVLLNTTGGNESGKVRFFDNAGNPRSVRVIGGLFGEISDSFSYSIPSLGFFRLMTDGSPLTINTGSVQVIPDPGGATPAGSVIFSLSQGGILNTESGVPMATLTNHARVYVDLSNGHNTGLAMAAPGNSSVNATLVAFQADGVTQRGSIGNVNLNASGHDAKFADQFISGLPSGFTGVLDISSPTPFAAVTLRSLINSRGEFLITTFPIADFNQAAPTPIVFPQIADGGGYRTRFILVSAGAGTNLTLNFYGDDGSGISVGKSGIE